MFRDFSAFIFAVGYGVAIGIAAEKARIPEQVHDRFNEYLDSRARHTAVIMTDAAEQRRRELAMAAEGKAVIKGV